MTDLPVVGRATDWLFAGASLATLVVMIGVSLLAGLFLLAPLILVAILLKTAFRHYFGAADVHQSRPS
jgi:hypothetical protein